VIGSGDATQAIGGPWGGSFVQGTNYALHSPTLAAGADLTISVTATPGASNARIVGFRVVQMTNHVPEPGTALLVALAGGMALVLRRRAAA
jgi:hypothetical protein